LSKSEQTLLNEVPFRGTGTPMPPTDPLIYRFYELIMVNGPALKALIEEEFGDGIMSAIDFDMDIMSNRIQLRPPFASNIDPLKLGWSGLIHVVHRRAPRPTPRVSSRWRRRPWEMPVHPHG
jgi:hypothetical protein